MAAAVAPTVIDFDPLTAIIFLVVFGVGGYIALRLWRKYSKGSTLSDQRGVMKQIFDFNKLPTVPTIRIVSRGGLLALELGKRAKLRDNSLKDTIADKGWDIHSAPIPIIEGKTMELGYITHPAGTTVELKPVVKVIAADDNGYPIKQGEPIYDVFGNPTDKTYSETKYVEVAFEGVIGTESDLDDFNESTEREVSRGWVVPLLIGIIAGVVFFAPLFAYFMSWAAGAGK